MPNLNVTFNGAPIYIPGVYYADNVSATLNPTQPPTPPLLVVGYGYGGKPLTPYTFTSFGNWQQFVRGGPVSNYANFIGNPSPSLNGAQYITYINASTNTQSTLTLNNSSASGVLSLKSANYGPPSNLLQAQVTIAPYFNTAGVGISLTLTDSYANTSLTGNNLGLPMQVAYLGTASSGVSFAISATAMTFTSPTAGESLTFPLGVSGYSTVASLVNAINGSNHYSAALISDTQGLLPSSGLDAATGTSLPVSGASGLVYEVATAFVNEPAFWVNQFASTLASATGTAVATGTALPAVQGPTYFSGASGGAPTNSTYASAFNVGLTTAAWTVIADSNTPAVQALGAQHAETASTTSYGKWRRFFTGSQAGDSVSTTVAKAASLNSITCCYVYPGIYRTNTSTGLNQLYDGSYAAAALAAMAAGNTINIPLTNKPLTGNGLEVNLTSSQINTLQNGGVIPLALLGPNQNVPTVEATSRPGNRTPIRPTCLRRKSPAVGGSHILW
jgi:hypothetical protein